MTRKAWYGCEEAQNSMGRMMGLPSPSPEESYSPVEPIFRFEHSVTSTQTKRNGLLCRGEGCPKTPGEGPADLPGKVGEAPLRRC
jgi:hypothetical protein